MSIRFDSTTPDCLLLGVGELDNPLLGGDGISISAWVKETTTGFNNFMIAVYIDGANMGFALGTTWLDFGIHARSCVADADQYTACATNRFTPNVWHHVVAVADFANDRLHIYVDGHHDADAAATFAHNTYQADGAPGNTDCLYATRVNQYGWEGLGAQTALWKTALSAADVARLYAGGIPVHRLPLTVEASSLVAYWPMHDGPTDEVVTGADRVRDAVGGHHGTDSGAPVFDDMRIVTLGAGPLNVLYEVEQNFPCSYTIVDNYARTGNVQDNFARAGTVQDNFAHSGTVRVVCPSPE